MDVITRPDTEGRHEALRIGGKNVETDARLKMRFSPLWRSRPARLSGSDGRRPVVTGPITEWQFPGDRKRKQTFDRLGSNGILRPVAVVRGRAPHDAS
jgi:hypothetical protein